MVLPQDSFLEVYPEETTMGIHENGLFFFFKQYLFFLYFFQMRKQTINCSRLPKTVVCTSRDTDYRETRGHSCRWGLEVVNEHALVSQVCPSTRATKTVAASNTSMPPVFTQPTRGFDFNSLHFVYTYLNSFFYFKRLNRIR